VAIATEAWYDCPLLSNLHHQWYVIQNNVTQYRTWRNR